MALAPRYVLGHSDAELERLRLQSTVCADVTRRMIRECGIAPGMRVLDIGCGVGDVAMLIADVVGPAGKVVAVDRELRAIEAARFRVREAGYRQIECVVTTDEALPEGLPFDAAVGRFVLVHQTDPTATVRRRRCGPAESSRSRSRQCSSRASFFRPSRFRSPFSPTRTGRRSSRRSFRAPTSPFGWSGSLRTPDCRRRSRFGNQCLGDPASPLVTLYAIGLRVMQPVFANLNIAPPDLGDLETLADRIRAQMAEVDAHLLSTPHACVWARRP